VAFAALLALGAVTAPAMAQQRNVDGGPPQQGMPGTINPQAAPQANYMADYHADYRVKIQGEPKEDAQGQGQGQGATTQRDPNRNRPTPVLDRTLGRTPGAWGR